MKQTIRLTESELKSLIRSIINENNEDKTEIFTLSVEDITNEDGIDDMEYAAQTYYSMDDAINAAKKTAQKYAGYDSVFNVYVFAGEYETGDGNVFGEPEAVYCVSNKGREETITARKNAGYTCLEIDDYTDSNNNLDESIRRAIRKVLK